MSLEKVFFVCKKVDGRSRETVFEIGAVGDRLPQGFHEVKNPPTRSLQMRNVIARKTGLETSFQRRMERR